MAVRTADKRTRPNRPPCIPCRVFSGSYDYTRRGVAVPISGENRDGRIIIVPRRSTGAQAVLQTVQPQPRRTTGCQVLLHLRLIHPLPESVAGQEECIAVARRVLHSRGVG